MYYDAYRFLMLTDCGPSHFSIWKQLARQDSATVIHQLEVVFFEQGPPQELLTDNDQPSAVSRVLTCGFVAEMV